MGAARHSRRWAALCRGRDMTAIDWAAKPEPWRSIGPAFKRDVEKIVGYDRQHRARAERALGGSPVDVGRGGDAALDGAASNRSESDRPAPRPDAGGGLVEGPSIAHQPGGAARRRPEREPERPRELVSPPPVSRERYFEDDDAEEAARAIIRASRGLPA